MERIWSVCERGNKDGQFRFYIAELSGIMLADINFRYIHRKADLINSETRIKK